MQRILLTALVLIINMALQPTVLHVIEIRSIIPNTAIVIIVSFALLKGSFCGGAVGFFTGLLQDIFFGMSLGYYTLLYMIIGWLCGKLNQNYYRENYFLPIAISCGAEFAFESAIYFSNAFMAGNLKYLYYLFNLIIPSIVYTGILVIPIYRIIFGVNAYIESFEQKSRSVFKQ